MTFVAAVLVAMVRAMWPEDIDPLCLIWVAAFGTATVTLASMLIAGGRSSVQNDAVGG